MSIRQLANGEASADLFTCSPALLFPASGSFTPVVWPVHSAVLRRLRCWCLTMPLGPGGIVDGSLLRDPRRTSKEGAEAHRTELGSSTPPQSNRSSRTGDGENKGARDAREEIRMADGTPCVGQFGAVGRRAERPSGAKGVARCWQQRAQQSGALWGTQQYSKGGALRARACTATRSGCARRQCLQQSKQACGGFSGRPMRHASECYSPFVGTTRECTSRRV